MTKRKLLILPLAAILASFLIGISILAGWIWQIPVLASFIPNSAPACFNAAIGIITVSLALLFQYGPASDKLKLSVLRAAGLFILLLGVISLAEYLLPINPWADRLFIRLAGLENTIGTEFPQRITVITSLNFTLLGSSLLLYNSRRAIDFLHISLPAVAFLSFCAIVGFNIIGDVPAHVHMPVPTGTAFILLCFALYHLQPVLKETRNFERNLYTALTAVIMTIAMISGLSLYYSKQQDLSNGRITRANRVLRLVEEVFTHTKHIESATRGFVITGDDIFLGNYDSLKNANPGHISRLKSLGADYPELKLFTDSLADLVSKRNEFAFQSVDMRRQNGMSESVKMVGSREGKIYMDQISALVANIEAREREELYSSQRQDTASGKAFKNTFFFFLGAIFCLLVIIFYLIRRNILTLDLSEKQSRESQAVFSSLFYKSPVMKLIGDLQTGEYLDANDAFAGFIGHTREEVIGKTSLELMVLSASENRDSIMAKLRADLQLRNAEMRIRAAGGEDRWVSCNTDVLQIFGRTCYISAFTDITERKETEEKLKAFNHELEKRVQERTEDIKRSEERYRYLFANNPMPMFILDEDTFRFLDVNQRALQVYGYSYDEFLSMTAADIRPEAERERFIKQNRSQGQGSWNFNRGVWTHIKKDKTTMQVEVFAHQVFFGGTRARLTLCNDVTEQKAAEEKLVASEERFRSLIENSVEGISLLDEKLTIIYRSPSSERITGYSPDHSLLEVIHPDDLPAVQKSIETARRSPGIPVPYEGRYRHHEGHYFWLEGTLTNLLDVKGVNAYVSNFRDVTIRKKNEEQIRQSEQRLRSTMDNMLEGVQIVDFNWRYIYVNEACARQARCERADLIGYTLMEKFPGVEQTPLYKAFERCFKDRVPIHMENEFPFPDGSSGWFELSFQPVPEGIFILSMDITERKRVEETIKKVNQELEARVVQRTSELKRSNEELEAFSYSVSHDLRAPLRGIIGFASILEEDYAPSLDEEGKRVINVIKSNTSRMGQLIDDLLMFSRMGRSEMTLHRVNSDALVADVVADLSERTEDVRVQWKIEPLPPVMADINMLRQVWVNLLSNAVKYSRKANPPRVEVSARHENNETIFTVKDNGVGFDDKYKDKLFKVFQRLHSQHEFEGTGVGLAIVEKIISKHGGRVWTSARPQEGASFYFSIPDEKG